MAPTKRILLVDDNRKDVELVLDALSEHELSQSTTVVRDGADALDYLYHRGRFADTAKELPDLVLLDLKMPKVDGLEVLRQIKSDPELRRIPVVMMSSSREQMDLSRSYDSGVNSYVVKPISFQKFLETISRVGLYWILANESPPDA